MQKIAQRIGVLGGGQLGKMLLEASVPLSLDISILDKDTNFPAAIHTSKFVKGNYQNFEDVIRFGKDKDIVTIEIESVNVEALKELERKGVKVYPQPHLLETINDKGLQKLFYQNNDLPSSTFKLYKNREDVVLAVQNGEIHLPFVQKSRKGGYDGKGVAVIKTQEELQKCMDTPCLVEELVDIDKELAVIISRTPSGDTKAYPVVEMEFHPTANLVEFLFAPSSVSPTIQNEATNLAIAVADKMNIVGLLAVELFLSKDGNILINEVAPRPHNSGHHTIEGCITSQFSQLLRCILDLPLGNTDLIQPSVMVNILGEKEHTGKAVYSGLDDVLKLKSVYPHLYGKAITKPYRKMGHITATDPSLDVAIARAKKAKKILKVIT